jgi:hypothetical protein
MIIGEMAGDPLRRSKQLRSLKPQRETMIPGRTQSVRLAETAATTAFTVASKVAASVLGSATGSALQITRMFA